MTNKLKWFVRFGKVFPESEGMWEVMRGNFRDSIHDSKYLAQQRCDYLNKIDEDVMRSKLDD